MKDNKSLTSWEQKVKTFSKNWLNKSFANKMQFNIKHTICVLYVLFVSIDVSEEYCSKFGRHLLQHQCVLTPESTEGPYYLPNQFIRRDIREDRQGLPFKLKLTLTDVNTCEPLSNISVDIWQCDANGHYSGVGDGQPIESDKGTFLRGIQMTDNNGKTEFLTIFPGKWFRVQLSIKLFIFINK